MLALSVLPGLAGCGAGASETALASTAPPTIRVLLGRERTDATLRVASESWEVLSAGGRPFSWRGSGDLSAPIAWGAGGILFAGRDTGTSALRIRPERFFTLDGTTYAGTLLVRKEGPRLQFVNEVDLETYVAGVVANELAPGAPPATFRAQAVAARTYGWMKAQDPTLADAPFQVYDSDRSQVYRGLTIPPVMMGSVTAEDTLRRAAETRGVVLTWQGKPFRAWYSSTCGGHTTDPWTGLQEDEPGLAPMRGVECQWCASSPKYAWDVQVGEADLLQGFAKDKRPLSAPIDNIEITQRGVGGWVRWIRVTYGPKHDTKDVPGAVFRRLAKLLSHNISRITKVPGGWRFEGNGWGHGVGMCQWGAMEMGRRGWSEKDILRYYYPDAAFTRVY